jgi:hypothetical protein
MKGENLMSESNQREAREQARLERESQERARIIEQRRRIISQIQEAFTKVQILITNRDARRAIIYIKRQLKEQKRDWQDRINDPKTEPRDADFLRGELHAAMMWLNVIENAKSMHERLERDGEDKLFASLAARSQQARPIQTGRQ